MRSITTCYTIQDITNFLSSVGMREPSSPISVSQLSKNCLYDKKPEVVSLNPSASPYMRLLRHALFTLLLLISMTLLPLSTLQHHWPIYPIRCLWVIKSLVESGALIWMFDRLNLKPRHDATEQCCSLHLECYARIHPNHNDGGCMYA